MSTAFIEAGDLFKTVELEGGIQGALDRLHIPRARQHDEILSMSLRFLAEKVSLTRTFTRKQAYILATGAIQR
jgi:hypothetical protein